MKHKHFLSISDMLRGGAGQGWRLAALAAFAVASIVGQAQTLPGTVRTGWVGNTNGTPAGHVMHTIDNAFVRPDSKVFAICNWDEGGANVSLFQDGQVKAPFVETGTGSWGRYSGVAITADADYVYQAFSQASGFGSPPQFPANGTTWYCVRRYLHNGQPAPFPGGFGYENGGNNNSGGSMLKTSDSALPVGLAVYQQELFVADPTGSGSIKVYNAGGLSQNTVRSFGMSNPGLLAVDAQGYLWMLQKDQRQLVRFSRTGTMQPQKIFFPGSVVPTAFCIDKNNRILVTDAGNDRNIKIYGDIFVTPSQVGTFGATGGIYSGTPGLEAPLKFTYPTGVGTDDAGNIYVANSAPSCGASMESYTAGGTRNWRLDGLVFTAVGDLDPATMSDIYLFNRRFKVDLSQPASTPWTPYSFTLDPIKYPNDPRGETANIYIMASSLIRTVNNRKLLYTSEMTAYTMSAFRFDGEIAVPAGFFTGGSAGSGAWPPQHPAGKELLWVDRNGDGQMQANEYEAKNADNEYGRGWWVDEAGGIWKTLREQGLRYYPCQGVDGNGVPQYSFASSVLYPIPANTLVDLQRIYYDNAQDVLYLTGWASGENGDAQGVWWSAGSTLCKFSNWKGGNRTADWKKTLSPLSADSKLLAKSFVVEGDYVFVAPFNRDEKGIVNVYKTADGQYVGSMAAGPEVGGRSGWMDINIAVTARKSSSGEYTVLLEENSNAKVLVYRWCPTGTCTSTQPPSTLRTPENPSNTAAGLDYKYYQGSWSQLPDFTALTAAKAGSVGGFDLGPRTQDDNFGFRYTGYVDVPTDGEYTFFTTSDDGSRLYIGNQLVVDNDGLHGSQERSGTIGLKRGKHALTVAFFEAGGDQQLGVSYAGPGLSKMPIPAAALFRAAGTTPPDPAGDLAGTYEIIARHSGKTLGIRDGSMADAAAAEQRTYTGATSQQWELTGVGDGYYKIIARHSGKALDMGGAHDGALATQWGYGGGANQQWKLEKVPAGVSLNRSPLPTTGAQARGPRLAVFPNPAHERVRVEFELSQTGPVQVELRDALGRVQFREMRPAQGTGWQRLEVSTAALAAGVYWLEVRPTAGPAIAPARVLVAH